MSWNLQPTFGWFGKRECVEEVGNERGGPFRVGIVCEFKQRMMGVCVVFNFIMGWKFQNKKRNMILKNQNSSKFPFSTQSILKRAKWTRVKIKQVQSFTYLLHHTNVLHLWSHLWMSHLHLLDSEVYQFSLWGGLKHRLLPSI